MLLGVPGVDEALDGILQVGHAAEHAAADGLAVDDREPGLHLVHPAGAGGREVEVHAGVLLQPLLDLRMFVGAVVVQHQMQGTAGITPDHQSKKGQEFLMPVAGAAAAAHLPGGHVQSGEQGGGSVPDIVVCPALDLAGPHRQERLGAVQRLNLGLLIDAQHHRFFRRVQVETHHVANLGDQLGVLAELEVAAAKGLDLVVTPDPQHRAGTHPHLTRHRRRGPVGLAFGRTAQGDTDDLGDRAFAIHPGPTPARRILLQPSDPGFGKPLPPQLNCGKRAPELGGDPQIGFPGCTQQDDPGSHDSPVREDPAVRPGSQDGALVGRENGRWDGVIWYASIIFSPPLNVQPISAVMH